MRIARAIIGAPTFLKPRGSPRLRSIIRVAPSPASDHSYVVSIGNGPWAVLITSRSPSTSSRISYVYSSRRPRKFATNATREPTRSGGSVFHSTALMFTYHLGAFSTSLTYAATSARGRAISVSVTTSTAMGRGKIPRE